MYKHPLCSRSAVLHLCVILLLSLTLGLKVAVSASDQPTDEEIATASSLAAMLRASRTVVSLNQDLINNPNLGDKGFDGKAVLAQTLPIYQKMTGTNALSVDPASREGRLLRAEMDAIAEVVDAYQPTLNMPGVGFKAFIPSTFGRLVSEAFGNRMASEAEVKVTAPPAFIRNRKARPDAWELQVIQERLLAPDWPKGQFYAAVAENRGRPAFRMAMPEYYGASCLTCHGGPKGEIDLTGYPKEGGQEGDLGGVISITLYR